MSKIIKIYNKMKKTKINLKCKGNIYILGTTEKCLFEIFFAVLPADILM